MGVWELRLLSGDMLEELAALFNDMEKLALAPANLTIDMIAFFPKPKGGDRPIAFMPMLAWFELARGSPPILPPPTNP